jgi:hypothetical protein
LEQLDQNLGHAGGFWKKPALLAPTPDRVIVFGNGSQLSLAHRTRENGAWSPWQTTMTQAVRRSSARSKALRCR